MIRMSAQEDLSIIIPVWNLPEDLAFLLGQIADLGVFSEVIVADDASDLDCHPEALGFSQDRLGARLVYLRSDQQRGAGHARNMGLAAVTSGNILFFDADDHLNENFSVIWQQHLAAGMPDFTIFRHSDTRVEESEGRQGTFSSEETLWDRALGKGNALGMLPIAAQAALCTISAYPWNKIYRHDFLTDAGITCSETPVHNDIRLHWLSFARARQIQASRLIGATHIVGERTHHLTSRKGAERLCLRGILSDLTQEIRNTPGKTILIPEFIHFVDNVCRWNLQQVDEDLIPEFTRLTIDAYLDFSADEFRLFAQSRPDRADAIVRFLLKEGA